MKTLFMTLLFACSTGWAAMETMSLKEVAIIHDRGDGTYDVVCKDGSKETVKDLDIKLNNLCPNATKSEPTGILSLQYREDGQFNVVCRDLSRVVASEEQILKGEVCQSAPATDIILQDGTYKATRGHTSFYDQPLKATASGGKLLKVNINLANGASVTMDCAGKICKGRWSFGGYVQIRVENTKSYTYWTDDGRGNLSEDALFELL
jgi:hypothetical protein